MTWNCLLSCVEFHPALNLGMYLPFWGVGPNTVLECTAERTYRISAPPGTLGPSTTHSEDSTATRHRTCSVLERADAALELVFDDIRPKPLDNASVVVAVGEIVVEC